MLNILKKIRLPFALAILPASSPETWQLTQVAEAIDNARLLLYEVGGGLAVVFLVYAGFVYVTAYGNEERAAQAKKIIIWTIVGIVVMICAGLIIDEVIALLS